MTYGQEHIVYESKLTLAGLESIANYMNDDEDITFSDEQIDKLSSALEDAIQETLHEVLEEFFNFAVGE